MDLVQTSLGGCCLGGAFGFCFLLSNASLGGHDNKESRCYLIWFDVIVGWFAYTTIGVSEVL